MRALLKSGAAIDEMNAVRSISRRSRAGASRSPPRRAGCDARVSGRARGRSLGDRLGPGGRGCVTFADARAVLEKYGIEPPEATVRRFLAAAREETPKPGDPRLARTEALVVARPQDALLAAAKVAWAAGVTPLILGDAIEGERGRWGGSWLRAPASASSVRARGAALGQRDDGHGAREGRGGRNLEFLLALGLALDGAEGIHALAADTDGIDGTEDAAGAVLGPTTLGSRARPRGLTPRSASATTTHGRSSPRRAG